MQSVVSVIEEAKDVSLITLREAKLGLNLYATSNQNIDDQIQMFIEQASHTAAIFCNRTFARETVSEQFIELGDGCTRLQLSHWPVDDTVAFTITEAKVELVADTDYLLDADEGLIIRQSDGLPTAWNMPVIVDYTGGYDLPFEAPKTLRQAAILLTREAYNAAIRGDSTIRSIGHKEARVIYFDPNVFARAMAAAGKGGGGTPAQRAAGSILQAYTRYWV